MLVLSRKSGQGIQMIIAGMNIELSVIQIAGNRVKIGLAAPDCVGILRSELVLASLPDSETGIDGELKAISEPLRKPR